jgi:hypothetical protein
MKAIHPKGPRLFNADIVAIFIPNLIHNVRGKFPSIVLREWSPIDNLY